MFPSHDPAPIKYFRILKEEATQKTMEARQKLFDEEKGKAYYTIDAKANKGSYYLEYKFPENCNSNDIISFKDELLEQGFKVEYENGLYKDILKISWYPDE